jgi:hypothetical protein
MDAEFTVELGSDDPTLAVPWQSPDGSVEYVDLRAHPEKIDELSEVREFQELGECLRALNTRDFVTAKCDACFDTLMDVDDEPYEAKMKCASYVDLFFTGERQLAPFAEHESKAREVVQRLRTDEELPARAEITVRRAYFREETGFYWTIYVFGYGDDTEDARANWGKALQAVLRAITFPVRQP